MIDIQLDGWSRLQHVFKEAQRLEAGERAAYLEGACGGDGALRSQVEQLLATDESDDQLLLDRSPALGMDWYETAELDGVGMPQRIGQYRITALIASGGMGTVYEAEQEHPQRTVALKLMRWCIASPSAQRRFQYESQLLARLRHPGIAQVFEAGTHQGEAGAVPYFAMEYVPGAKPITEYADQNRLSTHTRLELFAEVCDAVHHGHQKGIIHRDLKPGNILVDAEGQPRVIDFGVARATDSDMVLTSCGTQMGELIGTLQYMSPEQCAADPNDLDTRSDVYALGVVLYELLSGKLPYDVTSLALPEATRVIRDQPTTKLSTIDTLLGGDVETIVLKALEKERDRRYRSAAELADDIRRYLAGEAILARPASITYQLRVFARRNKVLVSGVAAVFVVLVAAVMVSTSLWRKAVAAENEAVAVTEFLTTTLSSADPYRIHGADLTLRDVLDQAAENIDKEFADQPLVEATLRSAIGRTYDKLTLWEEAKSHLAASLKIRRRVLGDQHKLVAESLNDLARSMRWSGGRASVIEEMLRDALAMRLKLLGEKDPATLESMHNLAMWLRDTAHLDEAETLFQKVLKLRQNQLGNQHPDVAHTMTELGVLLWWSEHYTRGEAQLRQALAMQRQLLGDDHPMVAFNLRSLGALLYDTGHFEEAELLLREAVAIERNALGGQHHYAKSSNVLGRVLREKGELEEAETLLREVLEKSRARYGDESPRTGYARSQLGECLIKMGRYEKAENELLEAQRILEAERGQGGWNVRMAKTVLRLVTLYEVWGKHDETAKWRATLTEVLPSTTAR